MKHDELKDYLDQVWDLLNQNETNHSNRVLQSNNPADIRRNLSSALPEKSTPFSNLLQTFAKEILPGLNRNTSPNFGAYITGSGNKIGALAEFIKAYYNQNGLKWNNSPIASELEQLVIKWISNFCLLSEHQKGVLTSGGSMSNLMAMHFALAARYPNREMEGLYGDSKFTVYCSDQTHSSVDRAMVFLGLGRDQLRKINVNEHFQIQLSELHDIIIKDIKSGFIPLMIIGNAGTTNTGSIDDLDGLAEVAKKHNVWFHVDGAYGLPARRLQALKETFKGVELADSITINPHKWMYVPFEASCVLLREIPLAIHFSPDYLFTENPGERWESSNHTIELTKEFRALKVWFTMKYYGVGQLADFIQHDIEMINYLSDMLSQIPNIDVNPNHPLSILCFRYADYSLSEDENEQINISTIRRIEAEGKIFITGTKLYDKTYLRVYYGNPERTKKDVDYMVRVIKETFEKV